MFESLTALYPLDGLLLKVWRSIKAVFRGLRLAFTFLPVNEHSPIFTLNGIHPTSLSGPSPDFQVFGSYSIVWLLGDRFPSLTECWWTWFIWSVELSGAAAIKFTQWASTRNDVFPNEFCERFAKLHSGARVHPWSDTEAVLENAYGSLLIDPTDHHASTGRKASCMFCYPPPGVGWRDFLNVDPDPVGSGCIAQVGSPALVMMCVGGY